MSKLCSIRAQNSRVVSVAMEPQQVKEGYLVKKVKLTQTITITFLKFLLDNDAVLVLQTYQINLSSYTEMFHA